jgi:hypothetical protein
LNPAFSLINTIPAGTVALTGEIILHIPVHQEKKWKKIWIILIWLRKTWLQKPVIGDNKAAVLPKFYNFHECNFTEDCIMMRTKSASTWHSDDIDKKKKKECVRYIIIWSSECINQMCPASHSGSSTLRIQVFFNS